MGGEHIKNSKGKFIAESSMKDAFGHNQLGGVAPMLGDLINQKLKLKNHWAVADYLQRSATHISSDVDRKHAYEVGKKAVQYALKGMNGTMPIIKRTNNHPYRWKVVPASLTKIANVEKKLPSSFVSKDGFGLTNKAKVYFKPLIGGKISIPNKIIYQSGKMQMVPKKLKPWNESV